MNLKLQWIVMKKIRTLRCLWQTMIPCRSFILLVSTYFTPGRVWLVEIPNPQRSNSFRWYCFSAFDTIIDVLVKSLSLSLSLCITGVLRWVEPFCLRVIYRCWWGTSRRWQEEWWCRDRRLLHLMVPKTPCYGNWYYLCTLWMTLQEVFDCLAL